MKSINGFAAALFIALSLVAVTGDATAAAAEAGKAAPGFSQNDQKGTQHSLREYKGQVLVLEWTNPGCPFVQRHYREGTFAALFDKYSASGLSWLAVNSTESNTSADSRKWAESQNLVYPTLIDSLGEMGHLFGAKTTPHVFVIGRDGKLVYSGAVDDDPSGEKPPSARTQYLDLAIQAALEGKLPERGETRSYGCSVKYRQ